MVNASRTWALMTRDFVDNEYAENPFAGSANNVPIATISRGIEIDMREINDEPQSQISPLLESAHNVQM